MSKEDTKADTDVDGGGEADAPVEKKHVKLKIKILKFVFSEAGLMIVIVLYILGGAVMFQSIELGREKAEAVEMFNKATAIEVRCHLVCINTVCP
jgi:hypothetical protein